MSSGYAPYLLKGLNSIAQGDDPQTKITPTGFLKMLLAANIVRGVNVLKLSTPQGQKRQVYAKYLQRASKDWVQTSDNCDIDLVQAYAEQEITATHTAKIGLYISFDDLKRYQEDAIATVMVGQPATAFMNELLTRVMSAANAIVGKIDSTLLSDVTFGTNVVTGLSSSTTVNINKDATENDLETGLTKILADAFENEMYGTLDIVGSGLFNNYQLQKIAAVAAMNGVDVSKFTGYNFFPDLYAKTEWGTNHIGVFSRGAIGLVDIEKWTGAFAGPHGTSTLFRASLPVVMGQNDGTLDSMQFDMQLKPIDCPTTLANHYGDDTTYEKGFALYITKNYGLFQLPSGSYTSDDRLYGNNGSLEYTVTNA